MAVKVFVDTDVVISSLISEKGAAFLLLTNTKGIQLYISNISLQETEKVVARLGLESEKGRDFIEKRLDVVEILEEASEIQAKFSNYVLDFDDAHIVAGSVTAKAQFLISYNIKDFKKAEIKEEFNIIVATPANLLQYLRSQ